MTDDAESQFEKQLATYFPDIYKLHMYGRFDPKLWEVIYALEDFYESRQYGSIEIIFQDGRINHAKKTVSLEKLVIVVKDSG